MLKKSVGDGRAVGRPTRWPQKQLLPRHREERVIGDGTSKIVIADTLQRMADCSRSQQPQTPMNKKNGENATENAPGIEDHNELEEDAEGKGRRAGHGPRSNSLPVNVSNKGRRFE